MSDPKTGAAAGATGGGPDEATALADLLALAPAADRARLAGVTAARPLIAARGAQLAREAFRAEARFGKDNPRAQKLAAQSARYAARQARVESEFTAAQVTTPAATPDATLIWGRVTEGGEPKEGVTVSARGANGEVQGFGCSDAAGGFAMQVPGKGTVQLRVTDQKDAVLYAGTEQIAIFPGAVYYRDIRIGETPVAMCRRPPDDGGAPEPDTVRVPDIVGRSEAEAARLLAAVGLRLGEHREVQSTEPPGRILRQNPEANTEAARGSAVAIDIAARTDRVVPRVVGLPVAEAGAVLERAGLDVADMNFRVDARRAGIVLEQDPAPEARVPVEQGIKLGIATAEKPAPAEQVLQLIALDPRFRQVRLDSNALAARAQELGLHDRAALTELAGADDAKVRDAFGLPALRDAQVMKRLLRDMLAKTE